MNNLVRLAMLLSSIVLQSAASSNRITMGLIILLVIESPVAILIAASLWGRRRRLKVTGLFLGWLLFMFGAFVGAVYVLGLVLSLFY